MTIRNTLMKMLIVETLIENLPQLMIIVTFMISELTSVSGKLLMIVKDGLVNYFGGNLIFLCLVIIFLHLNKFGFALLENSKSKYNQHGRSSKNNSYECLVIFDPF